MQVSWGRTCRRMCVLAWTGPAPLPSHTYTWSCAPVEHSLFGYKMKTLQKLLFLEGCLSLQNANFGLSFISEQAWCIPRAKHPVLRLKQPASSVKLRTWPTLANYLNWQHPHPDSDQLNVHLESAYCVQGKVPGPSLFGPGANQKRPGLTVGCVCVCVPAHACKHTGLYGY